MYEASHCSSPPPALCPSNSTQAMHDMFIKFWSVIVTIFLFLLSLFLGVSVLIEVLQQGGEQLGRHLVLMLPGIIEHVSVCPGDEVLLPPQAQRGPWTHTPRNMSVGFVCRFHG